jgi:hypothetical protein
VNLQIQVKNPGQVKVVLGMEVEMCVYTLTQGMVDVQLEAELSTMKAITEAITVAIMVAIKIAVAILKWRGDHLIEIKVKN